MFPKRLLAFTLFAALAVMPTCVLRAQWEKVNGPSVVGIGSIIVSGQNIYTEVGNVVYLSTDTGATWEQFTLSGKVVQWVGGCGKKLFAQTQDSFYVSRNAGETWSNNNNISKIAGVNSFAEIGLTVFAGGNSVQRSTDNGMSWVNMSSGLPNEGLEVQALVAIDSNLYTVASYGTWRGAISSIFCSTDFGNSWVLRSDSSINFFLLVAIGTNLFTTEEGGKVLRSTDGGLNWIGTGLTTSFDLNCMFVDGTVIYGGGATDRSWTHGNIFRSADSGVSWVQVGQWEPPVSSMAACGRKIFAGTTAGLFCSMDSCLSGELVGLPDLGVSSMFAVGNKLYTHGFLSKNQGITWTATDNDPWMMIDSTILATNNSGISYSSDNGDKWIQTNLPNTVGYLVRIGKYVFASTTFNVTDTDVFRSPDEGRTWSVVCQKVQPQFYGWLIPLTGNRLLYGGSYDDTHFAAYLSDDFGESWQFVDTTFLTNAYGSYIPFGLCCNVPKVTTQIGTILFGIDSGVFYRLSDDGSTWERVDSDLSIDSVRSAAAIGNNLFVCTTGGKIFLSIDTGATWKHINDGLIDSTISFVAATEQDLFVANTSDSCWRRSLLDFGIAAVTPVNPLRNSLKSYPNPLSQSTSITFTLPEASEVTLTITDALGCGTPLLHSAWMDAGQHDITWNASKIPSGVYLCRLSCSGESVTEQVVVMH
jgi:hypothetical protein